jgi:hypothetical protein
MMMTVRGMKKVSLRRRRRRRRKKMNRKKQLPFICRKPLW